MQATFKNGIKIFLPILFFICLADMPYGYFQLVRFVAVIGFAILAYDAYEGKRPNEVIIYIALGVLFQPLLKIGLGRTIWNIVDVIVGIGLLLSILIKPKLNPNK
jgi:hypothetical protein